MTDEAPTRPGGFQKGQSGNPAGRPAGARNKASLLLEKIMVDGARDVAEATVKAAKGGDMTAARLVLERLYPVRKGAAVRFDLPAIATAAEVSAAIGAVAGEVARGALTPEEGQAVAAILETRRKAIETVEIEARLAALEAMQNNGGDR